MVSTVRRVVVVTARDAGGKCTGRETVIMMLVSESEGEVWFFWGPGEEARGKLNWLLVEF